MNNGISVDDLRDIFKEAFDIGWEGVPLDFKHFKAAVMRDMEQRCGVPMASGLQERINRYCAVLEEAYDAGRRDAAERAVRGK